MKRKLKPNIPALKFIIDGISMCRWSDQNHSEVGFSLMDKHAHKFAIAIWIAWQKELENHQINWYRLFTGSLYEYLFKRWFTDLKPPALLIIGSAFEESIESAYQGLARNGFSKDFCDSFRNYFLTDSLEKDILEAGSKLTTLWEVNQVFACNPRTDDLAERKKDIMSKVNNLPLAKSTNEDNNFISYNELLGRLRKQKRWTRMDVLIRMSELAHEYFVAMMALMFCDDLQICSKGVYNTVISASLHDHPEAYTGDVPSPIKRYIPSFKEKLHALEEKFINDDVLPLFAPANREEFELFVFSSSRDSILTESGRINLSNDDDITKYNDDRYSPVLGRLVKACDNISAYLESYVTLDSGIHPRELREAYMRYYKENKNLCLHGIYFGDLYRKLWKEVKF